MKNRILFPRVTAFAGVCGLVLISGNVLAQDFSTPGASCVPALVAASEVAQVKRYNTGISWENTAKSMDFHCGGGTAYYGQAVNASFHVNTPSYTAQPVTCYVAQLYASASPFGGYGIYLGRLTSRTTNASTLMGGAGTNHRLNIVDSGYNQGLNFNYYCTLPKKVSASAFIYNVNSSHP